MSRPGKSVAQAFLAVAAHAMRRHAVVLAAAAGKGGRARGDGREPAMQAGSCRMRVGEREDVPGMEEEELSL